MYFNNPPKVQSHTQIFHGKIPMTQIYGTAEMHTSARYKILPLSESLHGNEFQYKLNEGKEFYNKISKEVVF